MDKKNEKDLELNTPGKVEEVDSAPITADDLIRRLKMNLKQNPKLQDEKIFEEVEASEEVSGEPAEAEEETAEDTSSEISFVETADDSSYAEEPKPEKKASVTASVKKLIASLRASEPVEEKAEEPEEADGFYDEPKADDAPEWSAVSADQLVFDTDDKKKEEEYEEFYATEPVSPAFAPENIDEKPAEEPAKESEIPEPEKEYSVLIETSSDKTNVFDPLSMKQTKKSDNVESLFEENDQFAVAEAEQLSFSMTEEDIQKSIEEAEAFIYEREHIDNAEEVINGTGELPLDENLLTDGENKENEYDQTDLWIASAFGDEDEIKGMLGEEKAQELQTQLDIDVQDYFEDQKNQVKTAKIFEEYSSPVQKKEIFDNYRKQHRFGFIKIIACAAVLLLALLFENISSFGSGISGMFNRENYPVVYILMSLQLLVLAGGLAWKQLYNGIRALFIFRPIPESIASTVVAASAVYHIAHCFISETNPKVSLYVFPAIFCVFIALIYDFINLKREIYSFNIVASKRMKYTIDHVDTDGATLENEAFSDYLSEEENVSMFKIGKTSFVKGFSARMNAYPRSYGIITVLLAAAVAIGLIFFIVATVLHDVKTAFSFGYLAFIFAVPTCSLTAFCLPFFRASKKAFDDDSAIVGNVSLAEYAKATTLSFNDKDVFPAYGVKVKSIKVYGDSRIDTVLYNAASVFKIIGGPLSDVFDTATHDLGSSDDTEIIEITKDGIEAIVGGRHLYLGKTSYIRSRDIAPIVEPEDEALEDSGEASIMYLVSDDMVSAKMYIQYTIDPDFEFTLRKLYKAGICIGIKTLDPNIDDKLLGSKVKITRYPVRILRCSSVEEAAEKDENVDSGIVSRGGPRSLLSAFVLCAKVLYANRTNVTVKILSIAFSVLLMAFLLVFSQVTAIPSIYVVLYQLFWMIPVYLISKFFV